MAKKSAQAVENANTGIPDGGDTQPVTESKVNTTDVAAQTEALAGAWPEVQPHAVAAMRAETEAQENPPTPSDTPAPKKRGRPPGSKSKISTLAKSGGAGNAKVEAQNVPAAVDYKLMGAQCAQLTFLVGTMVGGSDFAPMQKNPLTEVSDQEMLTDAYAKYAEAKQMPDLPPGVALCATLMVYVASRLQFPATQSRLQKVGIFFKNVWAKFRNRKNGARSNSGDNSLRQNDVEQTSGARP